MRRYVLTGTPGAGKTSILRALADLGHTVVEEAATSVIAGAQAGGEDEPWTRASFIEEIVEVQCRRQLEAPTTNSVQVYDRSPVCTHALARYLERPVPPSSATSASASSPAPAGSASRSRWSSRRSTNRATAPSATNSSTSPPPTWRTVSPRSPRRSRAPAHEGPGLDEVLRVLGPDAAADGSMGNPRDYDVLRQAEPVHRRSGRSRVCCKEVMRRVEAFTR